MARVTSNLKTSEMMRKGINPETVNALGTLWKARFEELTARAQEQGGAAFAMCPIVLCSWIGCLKCWSRCSQRGR